jgi:hypothetical protein
MRAVDPRTLVSLVSTRARQSRTPAVLLFVFLVSAACHGKPGEDCSDTPGSCLDKASHLVCVKKKYVLETCGGKTGCNDEGKTLLCDNSKAAIGDGCGIEGARACSSDGKAELRCRDSRFAVEWSCRGSCTLDASNNPKCTPTGEVGDACRPDSIVCDGKQKTQLSCIDGKLAVSRTCNGAIGCETTPGGGVRCDRSVAVEGEKCTEEDRGACDVTHKNVLVCTNGKFKTALHCLGALGCELPGNYSARCDKSIVPMDEPCEEESAVSCSTDGAQVQCTNGKWVVDKKWKPKPGETCSNRYRVSKETEKFEAR